MAFTKKVCAYYSDSRYLEISFNYFSQDEILVTRLKVTMVASTSVKIPLLSLWEFPHPGT